MNPYDVLIAIAIILFFIGWRKLRLIFLYDTWADCDATIISISEKYKFIAASEFQRIKYYYPDIRYKYKFEGKEYISNKVVEDIKDIWIPEVDSWGNELSLSKRFWCDWKNGDNVGMYINPSYPNQSIIIKKLSREGINHGIALLISGALILSIWFFF